MEGGGLGQEVRGRGAWVCGGTVLVFIFSFKASSSLPLMDTSVAYGAMTPE